MKYFEELKKSMNYLANNEKTIFIGQAVEVPGTAMTNTLKGINRILKKNGKFYISVPDMDSLCHFFISPLADKKIKFHVMRMIFGGQVDEYDYHYFGWNFQFLNDYLKEANFSKVERVHSFGLFNDTSDHKPYGFPISLNVIATK